MPAWSDPGLSSQRGGGGANPVTSGDSGGSGIVAVKEAGGASGMWDLQSHYIAIKKSEWPT